MVEPAVNSPRAPGLPSVLQQADDTSLPPMPNGSSPTAAHCACSTTPGASSDGDRGDSGVSPMRSCTTIMATTSECDPRVPAIPAVSSPAAGEDITQAAESGEAQTPYASGPHSVDATTLQRENTDLRAALASQNVILSSQIAERSSQMAAVLARLDTTAGPSQLGTQRAQVCRSSSDTLPCIFRRRPSHPPSQIVPSKSQEETDPMCRHVATHSIPLPQMTLRRHLCGARGAALIFRERVRIFRRARDTAGDV